MMLDPLLLLEPSTSAAVRTLLFQQSRKLQDQGPEPIIPAEQEGYWRGWLSYGYEEGELRLEGDFLQSLTRPDGAIEVTSEGVAFELLGKLLLSLLVGVRVLDLSWYG